MKTIRLPDYLAMKLDLLAARFAVRTGERAIDVRRGLEITCVQRGIQAIEDEIRAAEEVEAKGQREALGS